jgi:hypothetical protein
MPHRKWKLVEYVREKFTSRECEKISQSPAPFRSTCCRAAFSSTTLFRLYPAIGGDSTDMGVRRRHRQRGSAVGAEREQSGRNDPLLAGSLWLGRDA